MTLKRTHKSLILNDIAKLQCKTLVENKNDKRYLLSKR